MSGTVLPQRQKPEVCGKFKTCRAHRDAATPLPAVSLREKGGVLMGSGICRILRERVEGKLLEQTDTQAPHSCLAPNVIQPLGPICNKEKAGAAGTKHIIIKTINLFF